MHAPAHATGRPPAATRLRLPRATRPSLLDVAIALGLVVLTAVEVLAGPGGTREPWQLGVALLAMAGLAWRRVHPVPVAVVLVLSNVLTDPQQQFSTVLALVVATYSLGFHARPPAGYVGLGLVAVPFVLAQLASDPVPSDLAAAGVFVIGPWAVGWASARRALQAAEAIARAERVEQEQRRQAEEAVAAERGRIARELHDVVSHSLSVVTIQVQAVRRRLAADQGREADDLASVEAVSREALAEMRRLLGVLRSEDGGGETAELAPQPGLGDLPRLVQRAEHPGTSVTLRTDGDAVPLSPGQDLVAYRIAQEALTNAVRHAGASRIEVLLRWAPHALTVEVTDDGRGGATTAARGGHGLVGVRERAALYGGEVALLDRPGGGTVLRAVLPLATAPQGAR